MRLGVIADVHGNDVALRAVLDDAARHRVDRWWGSWATWSCAACWIRPACSTTWPRCPRSCACRSPADPWSWACTPRPSPTTGPASTPPPGQHLHDLLAGCGADVVVGDHTHYQVDRMVAGIRALNPGSIGMPRPPRQACWLLLHDSARHDSIPPGSARHDSARHDGIPPGLTAEFTACRSTPTAWSATCTAATRTPPSSSAS